jgi:hypothetical protein
MTRTRVRWRRIGDDLGHALLVCVSALATAALLTWAADGIAWVLGRLP